MNVKPYPTIIQAIGLATFFVLFQIIIGVPIMLIKSKLHLQSESINSLFLLIAYVNSVIPVIWIGFLRINATREQPYRLKFKPVPVLVLVAGIIMMLGIAVLTDPLSVFLPMPDLVKKMFSDMSAPNIYAVITAVIAAPLLEETLFRGIILNGLLKNCKPATAITISAALFGLVHLNPWQAIPAFLGGLLIGWLYYKTNSIIPGLVLHFSNNLFATVISIKYPQMDTFKSLMGWTSYGVLIAATALTCFLLYRLLKWHFSKAERNAILID